VYLAAILAGGVLEVAWPLPLVPRRVAPLGGLLLVAGAALFVSAVREFRRAGTPVPGNLQSTTVVRSGPYRFSRNPIYVAFSLLHLGIAISLDSVWLLATLVATIAVMAFVVIPREERYMTRRFGADYLDYRRRVRRWL
jgi:protein-S-isoprenylcysteine O-methyltransferase Ste14